MAAYRTPETYLLWGKSGSSPPLSGGQVRASVSSLVMWANHHAYCTVLLWILANLCVYRIWHAWVRGHSVRILPQCAAGTRVYPGIEKKTLQTVQYQNLK